MSPILQAWLPVGFLVLAIWLGLIYNNKRLDDFKDLLRSEIGGLRHELRGEMASVRGEVAVSRAEAMSELAGIRTELHDLNRRLERLEEVRR